MHFTAFLTLLLTGLALSVPLIKRDITVIETDLATISTQLAELDTQLQAFTGSLIAGLSIYAGILTLEGYIETATEDVIANGALTLEDSATLNGLGTDLTTQLGEILVDVIAKVEVIESTGLTATILGVLEDVKEDADDLFAAFESVVDDEYIDDLEALQAEIEADYEEVVAALSA